MWILTGDDMYNADHISEIFVKDGRTCIVMDGLARDIGDDNAMCDILNYLEATDQLVEVEE